MKAVLSLFLFTFCLFSQAPASKKNPAAAASKAPAPAPPLPPDAVVAKVGGKPVTAADMKALLDTLPSDLQRSLIENPKPALQALYLLKYLAGEGEKAKFGDQSPVKEQIEIARAQILSQAVVTAQRAKITVGEDEARKRFDEDPSAFSTAKVSIILVTFPDPKDPVPPPAKGEEPKKRLTEAEAKAKAEDLVKRARDGESFADLARQYSEDKASAAKGGQYGVVKRNDQVPGMIKSAIFAQKEGGVTDPIQNGFGFYVIRVDEFGKQTYDDVHDELISTMRKERFDQWMDALQKQFEVSIENESFFPKPNTPVPGMKTSVTVVQ